MRGANQFVPKPTGTVRTVSGVVFESWHVGIQRYEWRSEDGRIVIRDSFRSCWSFASIDGSLIHKNDKPRKFRTRQNAAIAAVDIIRGQKSCTGT